MMATQGFGCGTMAVYGWACPVPPTDTGGVGAVDMRAFPVDTARKTEPFTIRTGAHGLALIPFDEIVEAVGATIIAFDLEQEAVAQVLVAFNVAAQGSGTKRLPKLLEQELLSDD